MKRNKSHCDCERKRFSERKIIMQPSQAIAEYVMAVRSRRGTERRRRMRRGRERRRLLTSAPLVLFFFELLIKQWSSSSLF